MWTTIIASFGALLGVVVGVLLEPLKAAFAIRARARQDRADRAVSLIDAATRTRALLLGANLLFRYEMRGEVKPDTDSHELIASYREARADLRRAVELLHLSGPTVLAEAADRVHEADRRLRATRFTPDDNGDEFDRDKQPLAVTEAATSLSRELRAFADLARKYCQ
jgi:hypothetical protein